MAKSDELIRAAQDKASQARLAEIQECESVKASLLAIITKNIENWLGEFAAELELNKDDPGTFDFRPGMNADVNASIELNLVWRNIKGAIVAKAYDNCLKTRGVAGVSLKLIFPDENIGMQCLYKKEFSLVFPCAALVVNGSQKWVFPCFESRVSDADLARFLIDVMEQEQKREQVRRNYADARRASERAGKYVAFEHSIAHGETEDDVRLALNNALCEFPDDAEYWDALHSSAVLGIRKEQAKWSQYLQDRDLIVDWMQDYMRCLRHNRKLLQKIQADYVDEFEVGKLTYGVVVTDEDGEKVLDESHVYVDMELSGVNPPVSHWIWCWTAERPQRRICIVNPIKIEMISDDILSKDNKDLVRKTWVKEALETLETPIVVEPVTFQAELKQAEFLEFPVCELGDLRKHPMHDKALHAAFEIVFGKEDQRAQNELYGLYYRAKQRPDELPVNNDEIPF